MRIIAGTRRSLPLKSVEGFDTRPTTDRIKETLFNMLQGRIPESHFLDLFAGTGQIGLEALSRGALRAVFVDSGKKQQKCIEENIAFTKFQAESRLLGYDVLSALRLLQGKESFDIIFMDPPYGQDLEKQVLEELSKSSLLKEDGLIVVEALLETDFSYVTLLGYDIQKEKCYKTNKHLFLTRHKND